MIKRLSLIKFEEKQGWVFLKSQCNGYCLLNNKTSTIRLLTTVTTQKRVDFLAIHSGFWDMSPVPLISTGNPWPASATTKSSVLLEAESFPDTVVLQPSRCQFHQQIDTKAQQYDSWWKRRCCVSLTLTLKFYHMFWITRARFTKILRPNPRHFRTLKVLKCLDC